MMDLQRVNAYMSKVEESEKNVLPHEGKRLKTGLRNGRRTGALAGCTEESVRTVWKAGHGTGGSFLPG